MKPEARRRRRLALAALLAVALPLLGGCASVGYYWQAVGGHLDLMARARPVEQVIDDPATSAALKQQLALALRIRDFATDELGLPDNASYRSYSDLGRPFALWNVFAAGEFSIEPKLWCFPVAGCVAYRGYFAQAGAERTAAELRAAGYQTHVGGVPAYSTLGWLDDPLLNTFIAYPEADLARLIFHELAHQLVFVRGDTVFNESFAVAVEFEGVRRWLERRGDPQAQAAFVAARERREAFLRLLIAHRAQLGELYRTGLTPEAMRERRAALRAQLREQYRAFREHWAIDGKPYAAFDRWFGDGPNNAQLAVVAIYSERVPAFQALLARHGGDLAAFYAAVRELAALPYAERWRRLDALAPR